MLRAWKHNIQVMVEGPGHVPMDQIEFNVKKQMGECSEAPFYVMGLLVTDGAALAGWHGDVLLCNT